MADEKNTKKTAKDDDDLAAKFKAMEARLAKAEALAKEKAQEAESLKQKLGAKPATTVEREPTTKGRFAKETESAEEFILVKTTFLREAGMPSPRLIKANPKRPVRVRLPATIQRRKRDKDGKVVVDDKGQAVFETVPQPTAPHVPHLYRADRAPGEPRPSHLPPQVRQRAPAQSR